MSDTYSYEVLEPGGHARLVGNVLDRISRASANPSSAVGSATALLGDAETASWMERTTAADGAALIEAVYGNTLRWNQLQMARTNTSENNGITFTEDGTGVVTVSGTSTVSSPETSFLNLQWILGIPAGHKVLFHGCPAGGSASTYYLRNGYMSSSGTFDTGNGMIVTKGENIVLQICVFGGVTVDSLVFKPQLFDLTQMFGAGNEPATVAEFEALFPEPYYPYDAGSLLPVRMEGVETVGFNQWDEEWEVGGLDNDGRPISQSERIRSKNFIQAIGGATYFYVNSASVSGNYANVYFYDSGYERIGYDGVYSPTSTTYTSYHNPFTAPQGTRYIKFAASPSYGSVYNNDICINISDPSRNGTYEPYWSSQRAIPVSTYFPNGMRGVGTGASMVCDELTNREAIHRVGEVDLGTLTWVYNADVPRFVSSELIGAARPASNATIANILSDRYTVIAINSLNAGNNATIGMSTGGYISVVDSAYTDAASFKTAMSGVMLHYALATPTTTPIDPLLPLSYRTGAGGTERVMVASGTTSAPPVFATRYPLDPADLAASIAPVDGPTAKTNHQVGDLLMLGFTLCKATQVIVTGETIAIGTNVTRTSVAAEIAALS